MQRAGRGDAVAGAVRGNGAGQVVAVGQGCGKCVSERQGGNRGPGIDPGAAPISGVLKLNAIHIANAVAIDHRGRQRRLAVAGPIGRDRDRGGKGFDAERDDGAKANIAGVVRLAGLRSVRSDWEFLVHWGGEQPIAAKNVQRLQEQTARAAINVHGDRGDIDTGCARRAREGWIAESDGGAVGWAG